MTSKEIQKIIDGNTKSAYNVEAAPSVQDMQALALWEIAKQLAIHNEQKWGAGVQTHHSNN